MSEEFFREFREVYTAHKEPEFQPRTKDKVLSRGTGIDREAVIGQCNSIYEAIHLAARATRRILVERRRSELDPYVSNVDGLQAIEAGEINPDDRLLVPTDEWRQTYYAKKLNQGWFWYR